MTKKKPGAVMGRPKGSGGGFTEPISSAVTEALGARLDREAAARGIGRGAFVRNILEAWDAEHPEPLRKLAKRKKPGAE